MRPSPGEVELYLGVGVVGMDHGDQGGQVGHRLLAHRGLLIGGEGAVVLQDHNVPLSASYLVFCDL